MLDAPLGVAVTLYVGLPSSPGAATRRSLKCRKYASSRCMARSCVTAMKQVASQAAIASSALTAFSSIIAGPPEGSRCAAGTADQCYGWRVVTESLSRRAPLPRIVTGGLST